MCAAPNLWFGVKLTRRGGSSRNVTDRGVVFEVAYWLGKEWVTAWWAILLLPTELIDSSSSSHTSTHKECYTSYRL
jgi:hypothetical protein